MDYIYEQEKQEVKDIVKQIKLVRQQMFDAE